MNDGQHDEHKPGFQRVGEAYVLPGRIEAIEREQTEAKKRDEDHKKQQQLLNRRLVRYTFLLFLVGVIGTGISVYQSITARHAADAAASAADTAADALTFTREAVERPFLVVASLTPYNFEANKRPYFVFAFQNAGRTPAMEISGNVTIGIRHPNIEPPPRNRDPMGDFVLPPIAAQTNSTRWVASQFALSADVMKELSGPEHRLFLFGYLRYKDGTGKSYELPDFCLVYRHIPDRPVGAIGTFDYCSAADEQQK